MRNFDIEHLINTRQVETFFQPIISARTQRPVGLEALSLTVCPETGEIISFPVLMQQAIVAGLAVELDRLCCERAVERFMALANRHHDLLLFLNPDTTIIDKGVVGSGHLINLVRHVGLKPENVIIELLESKITDTAVVELFARIHHEYGFLLAIDDMGSGCSSLERVMQLQPDMIKVDRMLVQDIHLDYYKQEVFKSLVGLARKVRALVVAEGIETEAEALTSLELGADMLQGYYFLPPQKIDQEILASFAVRVKEIASRYKTSRLDTIMKEQAELKFYHRVMSTVIVELKRVSEVGFEAKLKKFVNLFPALEYLYILDMNGMQITDSICCEEKSFCNSRKIFKASSLGADQSLKDYYLYIKAGTDQYTSRPYMSLASGKLCITSSVVFRDMHHRRFILCADFNP